MATLTTQIVTRAGTIITPVAAAGGGDAMSCGTYNWLRVVNGGGGSINVTIAIPSGTSPYGNVAYTSTVVAVGAGATKEIGPIITALYQDPTTGLAQITYSGVTSVTVAAIQLAQP